MKEIPGFENYCITKDGRVWSKQRIDPHGHKRKGRWLKSKVSHEGRLCVNLYKNGKLYTKKIHHLVLETFVGPCPKAMETRHLDGNRQNNKLENLKWGTRSENRHDAVKHGTIIGENHSQNKLSESDVRMIIYTYQTGLFSMQKVANMYSVCSQSVHNIIHKKTWKHVWKNI